MVRDVPYEGGSEAPPVVALHPFGNPCAWTTAPPREWPWHQLLAARRVGEVPSREYTGEELGAGVCVIVVDAPPGGGPRLHKHPYEEVFVV